MSTAGAAHSSDAAAPAVLDRTAEMDAEHLQRLEAPAPRMGAGHAARPGHASRRQYASLRGLDRVDHGGGQRGQQVPAPRPDIGEQEPLGGVEQERIGGLGLRIREAVVEERPFGRRSIFRRSAASRYRPIHSRESSSDTRSAEPGTPPSADARGRACPRAAGRSRT